MASQGTKWVFDTKKKRVVYPVNTIEVSNHPLKTTDTNLSQRTKSSSTVSSGSSSTAATPLLEPLSQALEGTDPLTQFAKDDADPLRSADKWETQTASTSIRKKSHTCITDGLIEPWSVHRNAILSKFTTSEKLSIVTSFLSGGEKVIVKAQSTAVEKIKTRLDQLDEFEEGSIRQEKNLTQQEYVARIEQLNSELVAAWSGEQRVRALKIAIQCAKLLSDTSVLQFYPSKFVLVTDVLDTFGKLVYERLRAKAQHFLPIHRLTEPITPESVPETARETCRNWFYKVASVRELIPRLYVEAALLKSQIFLGQVNSVNAATTISRLAKSVRGIGHPLVAIYIRCYLCRIAVNNGLSTDHLKTVMDAAIENFKEFLSSYNQITNNSIRSEVQLQKVELKSYVELYTPALDWILKMAAVSSNSNQFIDELLEVCKNQPNNGLLLNSLMVSFKPNQVAERALQLVEIISKSQDEGWPSHVLYRTLGLCLGQSAPPREHRRAVLKSVWNTVSMFTQPEHYIECAEVWIQYAVSHFSTREVNTFLGDIVKHLTPNRVFENYYVQLQTILNKLVSYINDFESLLIMNNFLSFLDLFQKETAKIEACRLIMTAYVYQSLSTTDPVVINTLMFLCKVLHDSVNAMTVDDEKRQIGNLITNFVRRVDYYFDYEQQLNFYVEARANFANLDAVLVQLVQCVASLSAATHKAVNGRHTRKTSAFVRACAAYCYITIPSVTSVPKKLQLYLLCGQVTLLNNSLGQADAFFKAALTLLSDFPQTYESNGKSSSSEQFLVEYIQNLLSTLLIVPDNPNQNPMYLTQGLLNVLKHYYYSWGTHSDVRINIYLNVLDMLATATQEYYPYHVDKVDSNDALYGLESAFVNEINLIAGSIIDEILSHLKYLGSQQSTESLKKQSSVATELFIRILLHADLDQTHLVTLAINLWQLAQKNNLANVKYSYQTLKYLKQRASKSDSKIFQDVVSKLKIQS